MARMVNTCASETQHYAVKHGNSRRGVPLMLKMPLDDHGRERGNTFFERLRRLSRRAQACSRGFHLPKHSSRGRRADHSTTVARK